MKSKKPVDHLPAFPSLLAACENLKQAGYKVCKSKMYNDKKKGTIRVNADGTVLETEVRAYAANLERKDGNIQDLNDVHNRRAEKDVELRDIRIRRMQFDFDKEQGKYIPKKDFHAELAARAAVFDNGFRHAFNMNARALIAIVGGKPEKSAEFLTELNRVLDEQLTSYATTKIYQVMFLEEE